MAYSLSIGGYEFDNPPEKYRKHLTLGNTPVPHYRKGLAQFYQSGQQELQFEAEGRLSLNEQNDLDELEDLQEIAIEGGEVEVNFDPFFSGTCIIEDDPFRQADELGHYRFVMTVNDVSTDTTAYPSHLTPTTGNTFKLGSFDFGYDPESVEENYERQTNTVDRLSGISQSIDTAGLVTKVTIDGNTDGAGQAALWDKARSNELSYLDAEFQKGWALIADLSVRNNENAPDYLNGLFQYSVDLLIVSNPEGGIGQVSSFIDHDVKNTGTYVSDDDSGDADFDGLEFEVSSGSGSLNDEYVEWSTTALTLTDDATNYVFVTDDDGDGSGEVKYNNSGFPSDCIRLYRAYTSGGAITKIEDLRSLLIQDNDADAGDFSSYKDNGDLYGTVATGTSPDDPNGKETTWPTVTNLLAYNATNYLFLEDPDSDGNGTISVNQSGYPADTVHMWRIETDGSGITNKYDDRPGDLTTDGSGDTSDSDLIFSDDMVIDDSAFEFARILALADSFDLADAGTLPWLGMASLQESIADIDDSDLLPAKGIASLSDTVPLNDGGSATGAGGGSATTETNTWGTASDWNAAVSESHVEHLSTPDKFQIGFFDDFETDLSKWTETLAASLSTSRVAEGSQSVYLDTGESYLRKDFSSFGDVQTFYYETWVNWNTSGRFEGPTGLDTDGDGTTGKTTDLFWDNSEHVEYDGNNRLNIFSGSTDTWYLLKYRHDGPNGNTDYVVEDINGNTVASGTLSHGVNYTDLNLFEWGQKDISSRDDAWVDATLIRWTDNGSLTTDWKTFGGDVAPSDLELTTGVTLNGQSATVYVESDTNGDGSVDETSDPISLNGSGGPYQVSGLSTSTNKYRLRFELSTSDKRDSPVVNSADLTGEYGSGNDADQNSRTTWRIDPGLFDRNGNEFEGGGVVTKFGG